MSKVLEFKVPTDSYYRLAVNEIIKDRAKYIAEVDGITEQEAIALVTEELQDDVEAWDWAINNMDLDDLAIFTHSDDFIDFGEAELA